MLRIRGRKKMNVRRLAVERLSQREAAGDVEKAPPLRRKALLFFRMRFMHRDAMGTLHSATSGIGCACALPHGGAPRSGEV